MPEDECREETVPRRTRTRKRERNTQRDSTCDAARDEKRSSTEDKLRARQAKIVLSQPQHASQNACAESEQKAADQHIPDDNSVP